MSNNNLETRVQHCYRRIGVITHYVKVHCAHILVKTEKEANRVLERLKKGEKFGKIAKEISLCPSRKRGGDLGTFSRGKMVKEFEKASFALQKGQVSPIIKTKYGYHIIRRLE